MKSLAAFLVAAMIWTAGLFTFAGRVADSTPAPPPPFHDGVGRELFALMRANADGAEQGASAMLATAGL